jgi:hypothetical protein
MPAPFTTVERIKALGQLRYDLFEGFADEAALDDFLEVFIGAVDGYLEANLADDIPASLEAGVVARLDLGAAYLALELVTASLKARKVYGTHAPFDSEESQSYDEPLNKEWKELALLMIGEWIPLEDPTPESAFARPVLVATTPVDYRSTSILTPIEQWNELLTRVRATALPFVAEGV